MESRKPQKEIHTNKAILVFVSFSVALRIETKEIIKNKYLKMDMSETLLLKLSKMG
jgi:hypothetical protein